MYKMYIYISLAYDVNPRQVIKQRIQTGQFVSAPEAVRLIVAKEGFRGLYAVCDTIYIKKIIKGFCFLLKCLHI